MGPHRVALRTYSDVPHAEVDCVYLRGHGIEASIADVHGANAGGPLLTINGQVRVEVPLEDREHALVLLEKRRRLHAQRERDEADDDLLRCPRCASEDVGTYHPFAVWVLLPVLLPFILLMFLIIPLVPFALGLLRQKRHYCGACGNRWK